MVTRPGPDAVRAEIINAALARITTGGAEQVSLRPLMAELSLTTGAFYRCFPGGREDLLNAVARTASQRVLDLLPDAETIDALAPYDALLELGRGLIDLMREQGRLLEFVLSYPLADDEGPYPLAQRTLTTVERAAADHGLDGSLLFTQLWGFVCGLGQLTRLGLVADPESLMSATLAALLSGDEPAQAPVSAVPSKENRSS